jgi:DNA polymerase-3 subunit epsilon/ATP-dependent DNA helicase DinG
VLDRRILTRRYGATFLQSLPECSVQVGGVHELPEAAERWLKTKDLHVSEEALATHGG